MKNQTSAISQGIRMLTVANMYPSDKDPVYGTFVRNFVEEIKHLNTSGINDIVVIKGRRFNALSKLVAYICFYTKLTARLLFGRYDLIYIHTITFPIPPVRLIGMFRKLPIVFNVHGDDVLPSGKLKKLLKKIAIPEVRKAKMVVSPSDYFKGVLLKEIPGLDPEKIFISPSGGIDAKFFITDHSTEQQSANPVPRIGYVSRIDNGKGWDTFLKALSELKSQAVRFKAVIAGRGAQTSQMLRMISGLQLNNCVEYLGPVSQDELPKLYATFDLFIFSSSLRESLGLVGLEAMAAGTPIIASDMAGPTEYVKNNINGYLFSPDNHTELAEAITLFLNSPGHTKKTMRIAAVETAKAYESKKIVRKLFNQLLRLVYRE